MSAEILGSCPHNILVAAVAVAVVEQIEIDLTVATTSQEVCWHGVGNGGTVGTEVGHLVVGVFLFQESLRSNEEGRPQDTVSRAKCCLGTVGGGGLGPDSSRRSLET